jgi:DNA-binding HxlR family transcriptional regulator
MKRTSFEAMTCSVAQSLELVGEWWTLLIVRDLFLGVNRFDQIQKRLGIARNVLTARLGTLIEAGVVSKSLYQDNPDRFDYRLTEKGRDLWPVIEAMRTWGDRWAAPDGPPLEMVHRSCGHKTHAQLVCGECGEPVAAGSFRAQPGPGARKAP